MAAENVRLLGTGFGLADHVEGVTEIVVVEVMDGNLTLSAHLHGRSQINWVKIERMQDGGSEVVDPGDRVWLPAVSALPFVCVLW